MDFSHRSGSYVNAATQTEENNEEVDQRQEVLASHTKLHETATGSQETATGSQKTAAEPQESVTATLEMDENDDEKKPKRYYFGYCDESTY